MIEVVAGIIERDRKYLIARRKGGKHFDGLWEFPGGTIEPGETYRECLHRELKEELGRNFVVEDFFDQTAYDYGDKQIKLTGYYATCNATTFSLNAHDILRWVPGNELGNYDFCPADLPFVKRLIKIDS